jgi:hypothetical protein
MTERLPNGIAPSISPPQVEEAFETLRQESIPALEDHHKALDEAGVRYDEVLRQTGSRVKAYQAFYKIKKKADKAFTKAIAPVIEKFCANPAVQVYDKLTRSLKPRE